jgi:glycosyltransferase involved in cell wall biosynthesis
VPRFFSALDLGVVCILDTAFGRYSFPQKAYEMLACGIPIAAADVGDIRSVLSAIPAALHRPDDAEDLARAITAQLSATRPPALHIPDWAEVMHPLQAALGSLVGPAPGRDAAAGT